MAVTRTADLADAQAQAVADWIVERIQRPDVADDLGTPEQNLAMKQMVGEMGKVPRDLAEEFGTAFKEALAARLKEPQDFPEDLYLYVPSYQNVLAPLEDYAYPSTRAFRELIYAAAERLPRAQEFASSLGPSGFKYTLSGVGITIGDEVTVSDDYGQKVIFAGRSPSPDVATDVASGYEL